MLMVSPSALSTIIETQNRERDRDRDDQGAAPAAEEEQDHQRRSDSAAISASRTTPLIDAAHEHRLIGQRLDLQLRRQTGSDARQRRS